MRTYEGFPAPERDMANVSPQVPPVPSDVSPITRTVFSLLSIGLGLVVCIWAVVAMFLEAENDLTSAILALAAGVCFIVAGIGIRNRGILLPAIGLILGVLLGVASRIAA